MSLFCNNCKRFVDTKTFPSEVEKNMTVACCVVCKTQIGTFSTPIKEVVREVVREVPVATKKAPEPETLAQVSVPADQMSRPAPKIRKKK